MRLIDRPTVCHCIILFSKCSKSEENERLNMHVQICYRYAIISQFDGMLVFLTVMML